MFYMARVTRGIEEQGHSAKQTPFSKVLTTNYPPTFLLTRKTRKTKETQSSGEAERRRLLRLRAARRRGGSAEGGANSALRELRVWRVERGGGERRAAGATGMTTENWWW